MNNEASRQREALETTNCRLRSEEAQKLTVEERMEKALHDLHEMRNEHMTVGRMAIAKFDYLFDLLISLINARKYV